YLQRLSELYSRSRGEDRLAMVLTAYVVGPGHLEDARDLARDVGLDPDAWWGSVEEVLPLLEDERFHRKMRCGYARGGHAVEYVYGVFRLHHFFRGQVGSRPGRLAAGLRPPTRSSRSG
ncbi:MAG: hypothetical protein ACREQY_02320, partial [Candidatus Binatia bacterium]